MPQRSIFNALLGDRLPERPLSNPRPSAPTNQFGQVRGEAPWRTPWGQASARVDRSALGDIARKLAPFNAGVNPLSLVLFVAQAGDGHLRAAQALSHLKDVSNVEDGLVLFNEIQTGLLEDNLRVATAVHAGRVVMELRAIAGVVPESVEGALPAVDTVLDGTAGHGFGGAKGPVAGGGAVVENIPTSAAARIQNAANRIGKPISVVGSRASGKAGPDSDWDFVIEAPHNSRHSASSSLPGAKNVQEGLPSNQDVLKGPLDPSRPHVTFFPE